MRLERLDVRGYRHLRGSWSFGPGLTLVTGPNEAGKSTLHDALVHSLFGFSSDERRRRRDGASAKDQRAPWVGGPFGLMLRALDAAGRPVTVEWDFAQDIMTMTHGSTGERLLHEQPRQRQEFSLGGALVGMSREEFRQVCCLFQAAGETVRPDEQLRASLQRAVAATSLVDVGVGTADDRLRELLSHLGFNARHYGFVARGRAADLRDSCDHLRGELEQVLAARAQLEAHAVALRSAQHRRDELAARSARLEQAVRRSAADDLSRRCERIDALAAVVAGRPPQTHAIDPEASGRVASLRDRLAALDDDHERLRREASRQEPAMKRSQQVLRDERERLERFAAHRDIDARAEDDVRDLLARRRALLELPAAEVEADGGPAPSRDPRLERYRDRRDALISTQAAPARWGSGLLAAAAALTLAAVAGAVQHPAFLALLVPAFACAVAARPRQTAPVDLTAEFGRPSIQELDRAVADEERRISTHEQSIASALAARRQRERGLAAVDRRLHEELSPFDGLSGDLIQRAEAYLWRCAQRREAGDAEARCARLEEALSRLRGPARELAEVERGIHRSQEELSRQFAAVGISEPDLEAAADAFAARLRAGEAAAQQRQEADQAAAELRAELAGATRPSFDRALAQARQALGEHEALHGRLEDSEPPGVDRRRLRDEAQSDHRQAELELTELLTRLAEREAGLADSAELRLELHAAASELARVEQLRDVVRLARESYQQAARETHRRVAPHLTAALQRSLPRITRGRYREAMVDEELDVRLHEPQTGRLVSVDQLSRGTRDQVALIQRLEIARLLDPTHGRAPLLLDDPFAHFDTARLRLGVELLEEVTLERQVVLFTEDQEVIDTVSELCAGWERIELADPVEGGMGLHQVPLAR